MNSGNRNSARLCLSLTLAGLLFALPRDASAGVRSGPVFNPSTGHVYYELEGSSWDDLEAQAVALGGHLTAINDVAESDWIHATFPGAVLAIGLTDAAVEGTWVWTTGEPLTFTNWASGEPNNWANEDYAGIWLPETGFRWNDHAAWSKGIAEVIPDVTITVPARTNPANGHVYLGVDGSSWTDMERQAMALGGHLVSINDRPEQDWLYSQFSAMGSPAIGLTDAAVEGHWTWTSGEAASWLNWAPGEPNNEGDEDYVMIWFGWGPYWNDGHDTSVLRGIVEMNAGTNIVRGPVLNPANGHLYTLVRGSWADVAAYAEEVGGHLVTINDAPENTWLTETFGSYGTAWIGLNDLWVEGLYEWPNGQPVLYTNWRAGEPNNGGWVIIGYRSAGWWSYVPVYGPGNEDFVCLNPDGTWTDVSGGPTAGLVEVPNQAPLADASRSQTEAISTNRLNASVRLDGTLSSDPDGDMLTYSWQLDGAEIATGAAADALIPLGTHEVVLRVSDGRLESTASVSVTVVFINHPPTADGSLTPREVISYNRVDAPVALDGSLSSDPDAVDTLGFEWWVDGEVVANAMSPTVTLGVGTHDVTLVVYDPDTSDSDSFTVTVIPYNTAPVADPGATEPQFISPDNESATVLLDGTWSYDAEDDPFVLSWMVDGVPVGSGPTLEVELTVGVHFVELMAEDWRDASFASIFIEVITAGAAAGQLGDTVASADIPDSVEGSLMSSLDAAAASFDSGNMNAGVNQLEAFKNKVKAQSGKKISAEVAQQLLDLAQSIIDSTLTD